ncbi:MAG: 16S rRNA (guanine(966)-N(2))-methyltransferase RsmD [Clostridia bacterium]|nr:16S rRNA (guanine(966)-N(2))-methyltransferase RsmD [Clostridia bacterium]
MGAVLWERCLLRVISGSARGLKLQSLEGQDTRPTLDRVKEALFSILSPYLREACVLDLFAGSGALGIEALSRGAEHVDFVDKFSSALDIVKENAAKAKMTEKSSFYLFDAERFLRERAQIYDIVFLDPPYAAGLYEPILNLILKKKLLRESGIIAMEWDYNAARPSVPTGFEVLKERKYGRVGISLLAVQ